MNEKAKAFEEAYRLRRKAVCDVFAEMSMADAKVTRDRATEFVYYG
jgi:hypothetical protein